VSKRDRLRLTPDLTTRDLWRSRRWSQGNDNFVYSSLWDSKSSFTCRKILRYGTFSLYFPSERKVCCGFLSPLKIHRLGRVLNPQPLGPVSSTLTTTPLRRLIPFMFHNFPCRLTTSFSSFCFAISDHKHFLLHINFHSHFLSWIQLTMDD
jgi:hypothetical protein